MLNAMREMSNIAGWTDDDDWVRVICDKKF